MQIKELFKDSPDFIHRFNIYLPDNYYIDENLKKNILYRQEDYEDKLNIPIENADYETVKSMLNESYNNKNIYKSENNNKNQVSYFDMDKNVRKRGATPV